MRNKKIGNINYFDEFIKFRDSHEINWERLDEEPERLINMISNRPINPDEINEAKYLLYLTFWIDDIYYLDKNRIINFPDVGTQLDQVRLFDDFPLIDMIRILNYHFSLNWFIKCNLRNEIAKYVYSMWKNYKNLDDGEINKKFKETFKKCKVSIKDHINTAYACDDIYDYNDIVDLTDFGYKKEKTGYRNYHFFIYIPLLKNNEDILLKLLEIMGFKRWQKYLLMGLFKLDLSIAFKLIKQTYLRLLNEGRFHHGKYEFECTDSLKYIVKKLYDKGLYLLNDDDVKDAVEKKNINLREDVFFGRYIIGNEDNYNNIYCICFSCNEGFKYYKKTATTESEEYDENNKANNDSEIYINYSSSWGGKEYQITPKCTECNETICEICAQICIYCLNQGKKFNVICFKCRCNLESHEYIQCCKDSSYIELACNECMKIHQGNCTKCWNIKVENGYYKKNATVASNIKD
jgi:hypothetical protein